MKLSLKKSKLIQSQRGGGERRSALWSESRDGRPRLELRKAPRVPWERTNFQYPEPGT